MTEQAQSTAPPDNGRPEHLNRLTGEDTTPAAPKAEAQRETECTKEQEAEVAFSQTYFVNGQNLLVRADSKSGLQIANPRFEVIDPDDEGEGGDSGDAYRPLPPQRPERRRGSRQPA